MRRACPASLAIASLLAACSRDGAPKPSKRSPSAQATLHSGAVADRNPRGIACGPHGLPPEQHFVAEGLCARVMAHRQGATRGLAFAPNGDLFAITTDGEVRRYRDVNGDGVFAGGAPETIVWARTNGAGHNCQFDATPNGAYLYCGDKAGVKRWRWSAEATSGGDGVEVVVGAPTGGQHPRHPVGIWDGWLYVVSASAGNAMDPMPPTYDDNRGVVRRFPLARLAPGKPMAWRDGEVFVRGVRNATAMGRDPKGRIIAVNNGLDDVRYRGEDVHEDNPAEVVLGLEKGKAYGWPFCFYAQRVVHEGELVAPGTPLAVAVGAKIPVLKEVLTAGVSNKDDAWCQANAARPLSFLQAHSSALSLTFVPSDTKGALPAHYRGGAVIALHGSWDRARSTGHKVIFLPLGDDGKFPMPTSTKDATQFPYETVFGGGRHGAARDGEWSWKVGDAGEDPVRPVGVAISPVDGALYVSSDNGHGGDEGAIYRVAVLGH